MPETYSLTFGSHWSVLGPFPIGTREAAWGADPLEHPRYSGFHNLEYSDSERFPSALAFNGTVGWSKRPLVVENLPSDSSSSSNSTSTGPYDLPISVSFQDIPFASLRSIYGWSATQFQTWARAELTLMGEKAQRVLLWTDGILELHVDDKHFFGGDFFQFRHAPTSLWLSPGHHRLEVRLIRDVRSMGDAEEPTVDAKLTLQVIGGDGLSLATETVVMPDYLRHHGFAGNFAAVRVRNDGSEDVEIVGVDALDERFEVALLDHGRHRTVLSGQTREIGIHLVRAGELRDEDNRIAVELVLRSDLSQSATNGVPVNMSFQIRTLQDPHKFTFRHPSGAVSYAILEAPDTSKLTDDNLTLPVLLNLHGAGLEVDSDAVRGLFKDLKPVTFWIVHPSGMTPWSGDDWHSWGFADAEAAVDAIQDWIKIVGWMKSGARIDRYYVVGHSNGGQGTWYALTHRPDRILGAAAVSGYTSIESYVPFQFWSDMEPAAAAVLASARLSYRHELLADNFAGIPVVQQHGSADDNVPPFHSRNMYQLASRTRGLEPRFLEIPEKGHWYEGVMLTDHLKQFYRSIDHTAADPKPPRSFTLVATPNGEIACRAGLTIEQLISPSQLGKIIAQTPGKKTELDLRTTNVCTLTFDPIHGLQDIASVLIDNQRFKLASTEESTTGKGARYFTRDKFGQWSSHDKQSAHKLGRTRSQMGGMDALLRTKGTITITYRDRAELDIAKVIAQNLYQYFRADAEIREADESHDGQALKGNVISLAHGPGEGLAYLHKKLQAQGSVKFPSEGLKISGTDGNHRSYDYCPGLGFYLLLPINTERIELIVWGCGLEDLRRVARLLPTTTGVGQPDFVVLGKESAWRGADGALALAFLDSNWTVAPGSFLT